MRLPVLAAAGLLAALSLGLGQAEAHGGGAHGGFSAGAGSFGSGFFFGGSFNNSSAFPGGRTVRRAPVFLGRPFVANHRVFLHRRVFARRFRPGQGRIFPGFAFLAPGPVVLLSPIQVPPEPGGGALPGPHVVRPHIIDIVPQKAEKSGLPLVLRGSVGEP